jgi:AMMECR1 domain-containing protein
MNNQIGSLFSNRLSTAYNQLRGDLGVPQTATDTIDKLVEKIQTSAAVEDRRTAVLGLKGLSRDWKEVSLYRESQEGQADHSGCRKARNVSVGRCPSA